ncbi:MAG: hypothetical protein AAB262_15965 [Elusimicrobiota bacterium]
MNRKGSVILHVLVSGVVVALIAALLLRVTMLRFLLTARSHKATQMKRADESTLARLSSVWNSSQMCTDFSGYVCTGTPGSCGCTCTSAGEPTVVATPVGPDCRLMITSPDLFPAPP